MQNGKKPPTLTEFEIAIEGGKILTLLTNGEVPGAFGRTFIYARKLENEWEITAADTYDDNRPKWIKVLTRTLVQNTQAISSNVTPVKNSDPVFTAHMIENLNGPELLHQFMGKVGDVLLYGLHLKAA